ncbi:MAG: hypothetical protein HGB15_00240 [Chlorobaculum sp.]|nr:hypothetical protein [Chlorobaculum sp.]
MQYLVARLSALITIIYADSERLSGRAENVRETRLVTSIPAFIYYERFINVKITAAGSSININGLNGFGDCVFYG